MLIKTKVKTYLSEDIDYIEKMENLGIPVIEENINTKWLDYVFDSEDIKSIIKLEDNTITITYKDDRQDLIKGDFNKLIKALQKEVLIVSI